MFHARCLGSYERFMSLSSAKATYCCPLCRYENYQKRATEAGKHAFHTLCAVDIQRVWRGHCARKVALKLRMERDPRLKRKVLGDKLARIGDRLRSRQEAQQRAVERQLANMEAQRTRARAEGMGHDEWAVLEKRVVAELAQEEAECECSICMGAMHVKTHQRDRSGQVRGVVLTSCGHVFHHVCLQSFESFQRGNTSGVVCPLCRSYYTSKPINS
jgi:hypothetical protein